MWQERDRKTVHDALYFVKNGIATAMHADEERALGGDYRTINPCFAEGPSLGRPFQRYVGKVPGLRVWNIFTGKPVELENYSMEEHRRTVDGLLADAPVPGLGAG